MHVTPCFQQCQVPLIMTQLRICWNLLRLSQLYRGQTEDFFFISEFELLICVFLQTVLIKTYIDEYCYREVIKAVDQVPQKDDKEQMTAPQPPKKLLSVKGQQC